MECAAVGGTVAKETHSHAVTVEPLACKSCASADADTSANYAVCADYAKLRVGDVHRAAFALAVSGLLAHQLRHHQLYIAALGNEMAVSSVRAQYIVILAQCPAGTNRHGFLAAVKVDRAAQFSFCVQITCTILKFADQKHSFVRIDFSVFIQCDFTSLSKICILLLLGYIADI